VSKKKTLEKTEAFVRRVLAKSFNQKVDADTLRAVAEKVSEVINASKKPETVPKKAA
jgi:Zn-finger domain-containing protein